MHFVHVLQLASCIEVARQLVRGGATPWACVTAWGFHDDPLRAAAKGRLPDVLCVIVLPDDQYAVLRCFGGSR